MVLPGSSNYPPAHTEVEAQNQIVKLLFNLVNTFGSINTHLGNIETQLKTISVRINRINQ